MKPILESATSYAQRGWAVFPCAVGLKTPLPELAPHGRNDATIDLDRILAWWGKAPKANIGLATGQESGVWVFDVDPPKDQVGPSGIEWLTTLEEKHGPLPPTYRVRSGRGGWHYYFKWDPARPVANQTAVEWDDIRHHGLDVRGKGGYVVAPPSTYKGGSYQVVDELPVADAPGWLLDLVSPIIVEKPRPVLPPRTTPIGDAEQKRVRGMIRAACERISKLTDGRREALKDAAVNLGGYVQYVPLDEIGSHLLDAARACGADQRHDVPRLLAWGLSAGAERPHPDLPPDRERPQKTRIQGASVAVQQSQEGALEDVPEQRVRSGAARTALALMLEQAPLSPHAAALVFIGSPGVLEDLPTLVQDADWPLLRAKLRDPKLKLWTHLNQDVRKAENEAKRAQKRLDRVLQPTQETTRVIDRMQRGQLREDGTAPILNNAYNLGQILALDPRWSQRLRLNEFRNDEEIIEDGRWRSMQDVDAIAIGRWVSEHYHLDYGTSTINEQVILAASQRTVHPVREYLESLQWDGTPRLDTWLGTAFEAEPSMAVLRVGRAWLISMVARVMNPGCKVDTVPILVGIQGLKKSTTLRALMPDQSWFSDSDIPLRHSQDKYQVLQGVWLYEIAEFDRFGGKADAAEIKAYVSSQRDRYRKSFGRRVSIIDRQVVFAGSTNAAEFLVDPTGSRRYWPIRCQACDPEAVSQIRDQLWAEALHAYRAHEGWWLSSEDAEEIAAIADSFRVGDPWDEPLALWLAQNAGEIRFGGATMAEILERACGRELGEATKQEQMRAGAILTRCKWFKVKKEHGNRWYPPVLAPKLGT